MSMAEPFLVFSLCLPRFSSDPVPPGLCVSRGEECCRSNDSDVDNELDLRKLTETGLEERSIGEGS